MTLVAVLGASGSPTLRTGISYAAEPGIEIWQPRPPLNVRREGEGYLVELIKLVASRANVPIDRYEVLPYSRAIKEIPAGRNYCNGLVARTPDREKLFSWIAPTRRIIISAFAKSGMPNPPRTLADLRQHEIVVQRGTLGDLALMEFSIPATRIAETGQLVTMLSGNRVTLFVADYGIGMANARGAAVDVVEVMQLKETAGYFACSPGLDPAIARRLGDAFREIFAEGLDRPLAGDEFDSAVYERIRPRVDIELQN